METKGKNARLVVHLETLNLHSPGERRGVFRVFGRAPDDESIYRDVGRCYSPSEDRQN